MTVPAATASRRSRPRGRWTDRAAASATRRLRLPRPLHPVAWWGWALGMATAASRTTNPLLLALIVAVVGLVVACRRGEAPWARGFRAYVVLGLVVIGIRVASRIVFGGGDGTHVLVTLPEVPLPEAAAGIRIGGEVTVEAVLAAVYDGLRLATMLLCVGAATLLSDPKRLLKAVPAALHEVGTSVVVALTLAPQMVESARRVHRARLLRSPPERWRHLGQRVLVPVLADAVDRSLLLAAAMDARGFGRASATTPRDRFLTGTLVLAGLAGVATGIYGLLDATAPRALGLPLLVGGVAVAATGLGRGGRRVRRSVYRPDPWQGAEWTVVACGVVAAAGVWWGGSLDVDALHPSLSPLQWPVLPPGPALAVLVGALPAVLAPPLTLEGRR